jgi:hypothetical protein
VGGHAPRARGDMCARGAGSALLGGPSTSPLEAATKTHLESHEELGAGAEDPSLDATRARAGGNVLEGPSAALCLRFVATILPRAHSRLVYGVL